MHAILVLFTVLGFHSLVFCDDHPLKPIIRKVRADEILSDEEKTVLARSNENELPPSLQRLVRATLTGYVDCVVTNLCNICENVFNEKPSF